MSLQINIKVTDTATPVLAQLQEELCDRTEQHGYIAFAAEAGMRMHIGLFAKGSEVLERRLQAQRWYFFYQLPPRALIRRTVEMWRWAEICAV